MSYWKKALSIGLAAVMTASMLAGCGGNNKDTAQSGGNTAGTQASDTAESADNGTSEDITTYKNRDCALDGCMACGFPGKRLYERAGRKAWNQNRMAGIL